jgi:hypothetical protein
VNAAEYTAFAAALETPRLLDLTQPPLAADAAIWTHPTKYEGCQAFADTARAVGAEILCYRSVRDPEGRANLAILACRAFSEPAPIAHQTWRLRLSGSGVQARCEFPPQALEFPRTAFAVDPRIAALNWQR